MKAALNHPGFKPRCQVCRMVLVLDNRSKKMMCPSCGWETVYREELYPRLETTQKLMH